MGSLINCLILLIGPVIQCSILSFLLSKQIDLNIYITFICFLPISLLLCESLKYKYYKSEIYAQSSLFNIFVAIIFIPVALTLTVVSQYCICIAICYEIFQLGTITSIVTAMIMLFLYFILLTGIPCLLIYKKAYILILVQLIVIILVTWVVYVVCNIYFKTQIICILLAIVNAYLHYSVSKESLTKAIAML
jgi:hypothetical protein